MIKKLSSFLNEISRDSCLFRRLLIMIRERPVIGFFSYIYMISYSYYVSYKLFGFSLKPKVYFSSDVFPVIVNKNKKCFVSAPVGIAIVFESFIHGVERTTITISENASLVIDNTFYLGDGCRILLLAGSCLKLLGGINKSRSGITCGSKLVCSNKITIGSGTIISWSCYISDSTIHSINGVVHSAPINIGNHVWISESVSIGHGVDVGDGSIVASKSFLNKIYPQNVLIAGCPAIVKNNAVEWER